MSVLSSTNSGADLIKPDRIDYTEANFHLSYFDSSYKFYGCNYLKLKVEFIKEITSLPTSQNFQIKNVICPIWKDGTEYNLYIVTKDQLKLVEEYFEHRYYKATQCADITREYELRDQLIEIAQEQWKAYKKRNFPNWR